MSLASVPLPVLMIGGTITGIGHALNMAITKNAIDPVASVLTILQGKRILMWAHANIAYNSPTRASLFVIGACLAGMILGNIFINNKFDTTSMATPTPTPSPTPSGDGSNSTVSNRTSMETSPAGKEEEGGNRGGLRQRGKNAARARAGTRKRVYIGEGPHGRRRGSQGSRTAKQPAARSKEDVK